MGDEVRRTQQGNNNVYCQDNELSWFDWSLLEEQAGLLRFVKKLIHFRLSLPGHTQQREMSLSELLHQADIRWHGVRLKEPAWSDDLHAISATVQGIGHWLHFLFNAFWEPLTFELPTPPLSGERGWRRIVDTYRESPEDFCAFQEAPQVSELSYQAAPRSVVFLLAEAANP